MLCPLLVQSYQLKTVVPIAQQWTVESPHLSVLLLMQYSLNFAIDGLNMLNSPSAKSDLLICVGRITPKSILPSSIKLGRPEKTAKCLPALITWSLQKAEEENPQQGRIIDWSSPYWMPSPTSWSKVSLALSMSRWWYSSIQPSSSYFGRHYLSQAVAAHSNILLAASSTSDS